MQSPLRNSVAWEFPAGPPPLLALAFGSQGPPGNAVMLIAHYHEHERSVVGIVVMEQQTALVVHRAAYIQPTHIWLVTRGEGLRCPDHTEYCGGCRFRPRSLKI